MKIILTTAVVLMLSITAFGAEPNRADIAAKRAATLKANVKDFQIGLSYVGDSDKPYYSLLLSVPKVDVKQADAFFLVAQRSEDQALKIIAYLKESGILERAFEKGDAVKLPQPSYRLIVIAGDLHLTASLGWDRDTLKSLDGLKKVLDGNAAKEMETLLGRLAGHRKEWDAAVK